MNRNYAIRDLSHLYDPYHDVIWFTFTDFSMMCAYSVPVDRRCDVLQVTEDILSGEYKQWDIEW